MRKHNICGGTDVTGFGLAGHALKMAIASNVTIKLNMSKVSLIGSAYKLVDDGCIPGASFRNLEFAEGRMVTDQDLDYNLKMIAFDAQTSGGLLMCVSPGISEFVLNDLQQMGLISSSVIGAVEEKNEKYLKLGN
jgi:selenide,water dikinase